jgi:hypothetical protein
VVIDRKTDKRIKNTFNEGHFAPSFMSFISTLAIAITVAESKILTTVVGING